MRALKIIILKLFGLVVATIGRISLAGTLMIFGAQALALVDHVEQYALLNGILLFERRLEAPIVSRIHAVASCVVAGVDVAPLALATALLVVWILCEAQVYNLERAAWTLVHESQLEA